MGASVWLALAALVVAVIGLPVTWLASRRYGTRRGSLGYYFARSSIAETGKDGQRVEVRVGGEVVTRPMAFEFTIANTGTKDLRQTDFDGGEPFRVHVGGRPLAIMRKPRDVPMELGNRSVKIPPRLLRIGMRWHITVLVDADDDDIGIIEGPIADFSVMSGYSDNLHELDARTGRAFAAVVIVLLLFGGLAGSAIALAF